MLNISIATEDILSEFSIIKLLEYIGNFNIVHKLGREGNGYLMSKLNNFNKLAERHTMLVVTDLDNKKDHNTYVLELKKRIQKPHGNLIFSIPVREIESWLLADREGLSEFLSVSKDKITRQPESLLDPKDEIINIAKSCKNKEARVGIPPQKNVINKMGISYNRMLASYISNNWSVERAIDNSSSLRLTYELLEKIRDQHQI